jgi:pentatricopeptide repeat protein
LLLLDNDNQIGKLPSLWRELCNLPAQTVSIIHLNALIWAYVKRGQWDVVGSLYNAVVGDEASTAFSGKPYFSSKPLPVPTGIHPSRATFQCVMRGLAHHGNLFSALLVLEDMTRAGQEPLVSDFIALFQGFARFGRVATDSQRASNSQRIPSVETFTKTPVPTLTTAPKSPTRRLSDIWAESMKFESDLPESTSDHDEWTLDNLNALFDSLIDLPPPSSRTPVSPWAQPRRDPLAQAPSPRAVFYVLMAFSRVRGNDPVVLQEVFGRLEGKFGSRNKEGWIGWRLDRRLTRLRQDWESVKQCN